MTIPDTPVAMLVDDDPTTVQRLRRKFLRETCLGVLYAETLAEARVLLGDARLRIDAVVTDLGFRESAQDEDSGVFDGLDLLTTAKTLRPNAPQYVISVLADDEAEKDKARRLKLNVVGWYQKLNEGKGASPPWGVIGEDVMQRLGNSSEQREMTRTTYLQSLRDGFTVHRPIPVIIDKITEYDAGEPEYHASAPELGLLSAEGWGYSPDEAVEDLAETIADEAAGLGGASELVGYALFIQRRLSAYVSCE